MSAAHALALHRRPFLAGGDAVSVAGEDTLGSPSDDGFCGLVAEELFVELALELFDERHVRLVIRLIKVRPLCGGARLRLAL